MLTDKSSAHAHTRIHARTHTHKTKPKKQKAQNLLAFLGCEPLTIIYIQHMDAQNHDSEVSWKRTLVKNSSQKYQGDNRNPFHFIVPKDMTQNVG